MHKSLMNRLLLASLLLLCTDSVAAAELDCPRALGPVVPNAKTAKAIAVAVIAARQSTDHAKKYRLYVESDEERPGGWIVFQSLPFARSGDPNYINVITGGGGITMRIDRCSGEVSDMYYQR